MFPTLPEDVIDAVREIFASANNDVSNLLARQPGMHEEGLDFHLVSKLDEVGPLLVPSGAAVVIETHWLGGRRHWGRWEISDIALVVTVRARGYLVVRKAALLQTKRLYSREVPIETRDRSDYAIGIGRLIDRTDPAVPLFKQREFSFTGECLYGALSSGSEQVQRIDDYVETRGVPVYYALYNPPTIPLSGLYPALAKKREPEDNEVGCRVLRREEVHDALKQLPIGASPSFDGLKSAARATRFDRCADHGWRLETFVADEVMRCKEGKLFESMDDEVLSRLLYARSAPISSAIVVTIDLPESTGMPE